MRKILFTWLFISLGLFSFSQNGFDWGKSKTEAQPKYQNVSLFYNSDNYKNTIPRIQWLIKNAPNVHKNLYIWGASVYKKAEKEETDSLKKIIYQDSTLFMYDEQMNRFGAEKEASNFKGLVAYKYLSKRPNTTDTLYLLYKKIVDLNEEEAFKSNVYYFMALSLVKYSSNSITEDELLNTYQRVNAIYNQQKAQALSNGKSTSSIEKYSANVKKIFSKYYTLTCSSIEKLYTDKLSAETAQEVSSLLKEEGCTSSPLYLKALGVQVKENPTEENRLLLADYNYANGNKSKAIETYKNLLASSTKKGLLSYKLMSAYQASNRLLAISYAKKALENKYKVFEVATFIGDSYFNSLGECRTDDAVKTRAIYLAAHKYYEMAGNTAKMATAKAQFPSQEEVFLAEYKVGESISTGCWINETVVIQVR